ncbi:MAG TPA: GNAT family N-acetyltransferase [Streptosporangiaceae bacterium]|jgi:RimJ/RimL family protein N-acetyltransferase
MHDSVWPLAGLRLRTPALELRWPSERDLSALAEVAALGVHEPDVQPFMVPWTDAPPAERARSVLQYQWSCWGSWQPDNWRLGLVVVRDGVVAGVQDMNAHDFAVLRRVSTGSWLGQAYHGQGIGTEMRAAVLHLAFAGLGAEHAVSAAFQDNPSSRRVSHKLGYRDDGIEHYVVRGRSMLAHRLRLTRAGWEATRSVPVEIEGLAPCLPLFGALP